MKRSILLFLVGMFFACSQSDDGPIDIYPDGFDLDGYGYVLSAEIDSGFRFHVQGDTIRLTLDSMWTFGNCFLRNIELHLNFQEDTIAVVTVKLALGNTGITDCPSPIFRPDTTLLIAFPESWKSRNIRELRIEGNSHNDFFVGSEDTSVAANATFKDSILIRKGELRAESISVYLDSSFKKPYKFTRRTFNDTAGVLTVTDSIRVDTFEFRYVNAKCKVIHDTCEVIPDTIWNTSWRRLDTNTVQIRAVCAADTAGDSLVYCKSSNWKIDSTSFSDSVYNYLDTNWFNTNYFVEKIPHCASLDHGDFSGMVSFGRYFTTKHFVFVPASDEKSCGPAAHADWMIFDLKTKKEILDSAKADTLLSAWKKASVGIEKEKSNGTKRR